MAGTPYVTHEGAVRLLKPELKLLKPDPVGGKPLKVTSTESLLRFLPRYLTLSICKFGLQGVTCVDGRANPRCATASGIADNAQEISVDSHNRFRNSLFMLCILVMRTRLVFGLDLFFCVLRSCR